MKNTTFKSNLVLNSRCEDFDYKIGRMMKIIKANQSLAYQLLTEKWSFFRWRYLTVSLSFILCKVFGIMFSLLQLRGGDFWTETKFVKNEIKKFPTILYIEKNLSWHNIQSMLLSLKYISFNIFPPFQYFESFSKVL